MVASLARQGRFTSISSFATSLCILFLAGCGSWQIKEPDGFLNIQTQGEEMVVIERIKDRHSPKIKTYKHTELNIYKESAGSRWNDSYAVNRIETPPGTVQIGVVDNVRGKAYYQPDVEFKAMPGRHYLVTWVCIPSSYVVVIDAESSNIVGIDSYCPDCEHLLGNALPSSSECGKLLKPFSDVRDDMQSWGDIAIQKRRNLCYAAERGVASARMKLGIKYHMGYRGTSKDLIRAYVWYRLAAKSGDEQGRINAEYLGDKMLSPEDTEKAEWYLENWEVGKLCEEWINRD